MKKIPYTVTDIGALTGNARLLRKLAGDFYCVVKCRAYGHGEAECVKALYGAGMRRYAVSDISEALRIRPLSPDAEIVVLGACDVSGLHTAAANSLTLTLHDAEEAARVSETKTDMLPSFHIKLDTGMHRSGFDCDPETVFNALSGLTDRVTGIYTHFPRADAEDISETRAQLERFNDTADRLEILLKRRRGLVRHTAASPAFFRLPPELRGMCRIGLALYGVPPEHFVYYDHLSDNGSGIPGRLAPVMSFYSEISGIHTVRKGEYIGYGSVFRCKEDKIIATAAGGYANGILRYLKNASGVLPNAGSADIGENHPEYPCRPQLCCAEINGYPAALAGSPCMDRCMFDITPIFRNGGRVKPGDRVVFFGENRTVSEYAQALGTISYEALTTVGNLNYRIIKEN